MIDMYTTNEINKLESEISLLETKNAKLREMLSTIGIKTEVSMSNIRNP